MKKDLIKTISSIVIGIIAFYLFIAGISFYLYQNLDIGISSDVFTTIQTVNELILVPVAVIGFYLTYSQIKSSQEKPDLDLGWDSGGKIVQSYKAPRPGSINIVSKSLILFNDGNAPSLHYQVKLTFPKEFGRVSIRDGWDYAAHGNQVFIFGNPASMISFPGSRIDLGRVNFQDGKLIPNNISIPYEIYSDRGDFKEGNLDIKLSPTDFSQ